jgi:ribosome maturation factor RimP
MIDTQNITDLVNGAIAQNPELFLIELKILPGNVIYVEVDGDKGVSLKECIRISREVEHNLDREIEDFSLEVTSPDVTKPLTNKRQYLKNIGRKLLVKTTEGTTVEGILSRVDEDVIELKWKAREPKPIGKGKITVEKSATVPFNTIIESKVKIIF